jgi:hypothetical protein
MLDQELVHVVASIVNRGKSWGDLSRLVHERLGHRVGLRELRRAAAAALADDRLLAAARLARDRCRASAEKFVAAQGQFSQLREAFFSRRPS